ncbi:hypothetical protein KBC85_00505 [Candidatus Saccharibacteria bacterium]|nr:hypothetical protein [Candidatus Saccharibacteria bacterium]MDQ5885180.1 hypothetical protein [Patescibacteria group bacterium]MDQ5953577.1 hypothetical protein [Patescibacteria group bacterium]MDQ5958625.1 hypothetical protein [Patescibacteria group bacterium]
MPKTYAIIYGFAEGPKNAKIFNNFCKINGYKLVNQPNLADIIVAHSGGCFLVPKNNDAKKIILVNPPMCPKKRYPKTFYQNAKIEKTNIKYILYWFWRLFISLNHNFLILYKLYFIKNNLLPNSKNVIIIRNGNDPFICLNCYDKLVHAYTIFDFPGVHNELWLNPKPIVKLF